MYTYPKLVHRPTRQTFGRQDKQIDQILQSLFDVDFALLLHSPSLMEDYYSFGVLQSGDSVTPTCRLTNPKKAARAKIEDQQSCPEKLRKSRH